MSELMYQLDELAREAAKERAERENKKDPWGLVAEVVLAIVLAGFLDLFCC